MPKKLENRPTREDVQCAKELRDDATTVAEYRKALAVILIGDFGFTTYQVAEVLGVSRRTVLRDRMDVQHPSEDKVKKGKGGRRNFTLTNEEEETFLLQWEQRAMAGEVTNVYPIHDSLVRTLGRNVTLSTTYRLLARHGWYRVVPGGGVPRACAKWLPSKEGASE